MSSADITQAEIDAVNAVLHTPFLSIGPQIKEFEKEIAEFSGAKHGIGVNSGTSGLHMCVIAANVQDGDTVITSPFSFVASSNCVLYERALPIFVDVEEATGNIDAALLAEAAEDLAAGKGSRWMPPAIRDQKPGGLKALLPVHAFGQPADMDSIMATAARHELRVIEDACEAIGAEYKGRQAGLIGDAGVFAFYPNKQMTTGEGGIIVTDRDDWKDLFHSLRNQGRDVFDAWLNHSRLGFNYRLDEMSAALGLVQARRLNELLSNREKVAGWYNERLSELDLVKTPTVIDSTTKMSWFVYVVRILKPASRDKVMQALADENIPSRPYFSPIHLQTFYMDRFGYRRGDFPVTEYLGDVSLALPFSGVMTEAQVDRVVEVLAKTLKSDGVLVAST